MSRFAGVQGSLLDLPDRFARRRARASRPVHISGYARQEHDFHPTPDWVTDCLLRHVAFRGPVWEPCCGNGAIARVVAAHGHEVIATDLEDHGFGRSGVDFYACRAFPWLPIDADQSALWRRQQETNRARPDCCGASSGMHST